MTTLVVGGGISGLAAAWELSRRAVPLTLVEGSSRLGGEIVTEPFAGIDLESGPDSFLARVPAAVELAREVGLGDDLVAPATGKAFLWTRGRLRELPSGLVLGVPASPRALWSSSIVSRWAAARAALDVVLPGRPATVDIAVGELIRRRMGRGVQMGIVDPLVGGINAGHTDALSTAVVAPQLLAAAKHDRSLIRGLQATTPPPTGGPVFLTVRGGLSRLVEALRSELSASIVTGDPVTGLARNGDRWTATLASGRAIEATAVVIACPARRAAPLLEAASPAVAHVLRSIQTASVTVTTMTYPGNQAPLEGSGFLVPRRERRLMSACTWVGAKWPHLDTAGQLVVRVSSGRCDDTRAMDLGDGPLIDALHQELVAAMGVRGRPADARVHRWPDAFPQYEVGHGERIAAAEATLTKDAPGVFLAGASLRGVGLATCIAGGRAAGGAAAAFASTPAR